VKQLTAAEYTLQRLGITDPGEIDLEAIAWEEGARIKYRPLDGCEARIIGNDNNAIITVNSLSHRRRKRFSIAHELGHWKYHRGRLLVCRSDEIGSSGNCSHFERTADAYAADLLMPRYLFEPISQMYSMLNFQAIREISDKFDASRTATAIRLVENGHSPSVLVCHGSNGRRWFTRSPDVPTRWFPGDQLDPEGFAIDVLFGKKGDDRTPRKIGADAWFDRREAGRYEVHEQSIRTADDEILTLVLLSDTEMLEDDDTQSSWHRRR